MGDILRDFPTSFDTERLTIRGPRPGDGPALNAAVCESLEQLRPWMSWAMNAPSVADSEANIREACVHFSERTSLRLLLFLRGTDIIVGSSGLQYPNWSVPSFEIGYWVRTSYAGQGYVTEAVNGIAAFAFDVLGAKRVQIICNAKNERSAAVARRAGFTLEGTLHSVARHHLTNELVDELIFCKWRRE
jgi:ribosomal-protein-serine acetyltransferase